MNRKHMRGTYVVEFAIIGMLVFTLLFGVVGNGPPVLHGQCAG